MIASHSLAVWFCLFAFIAVQTTASGQRTKIAEERRVRALRPSFVKRDSQAPLLHAIDEKIEEEYIVKLKDDLSDEELRNFEEKFQALSEEHGLHIEFQINVTKLMKGFVARVPGDAVDILRWLDEVDFVEEDEVIHAAVSWGLDRIDQAYFPLDNVYSSPLGDGAGVNVFVMDSGIRFSHNEFRGRAHAFFDSISDGRNGADCFGHGTHCAGTVGGETVGVAPGVNLYSVRILDCNGNGPGSGFLSAMDAIAASNMKPAVVSMSLVGAYSITLNLAVQRLTEEGYIVVVCAGNAFHDACQFSPASAYEAITVGATESDDDFAWYSNYGWCVDILAPGSSITSASYTGDESYEQRTGTSMATPHVSGVAALILEQRPDVTPNQMVNLLLGVSLQNQVDVSNVPSSYRSETPNKLLQIPANLGGEFQCSLIVGSDLIGNSIGIVSEVTKAEDCCLHCQTNPRCSVWTWSINGKSCYLGDSITYVADMYGDVTGIVSRTSSGEMTCSGFTGTDLQGPNLDVVANTAYTDDCCAACLANSQCTVWAYDVSGKNCYLRHGFDNVVNTGSIVSGVLSRV